MRKGIVLSFHVLLVVMLLLMISGCGSSNKEAGPGVTVTDVANAAKLGDLNCLQCHNAGKDLTMDNDLDTRTIGAVWQNSLHNGDINGIQTVHCEDCHGGGQFHWGLGPLANPVPMANVCLQCHGGATAATLGLSDQSSFLATAHANGNNVPDSTFSEIPTPVSLGKHIEECSVCHDSNQRFVFDNSGNLLKPDPANLPVPQVSCASCHDAHQVGLTANVPPRVDGSTNVDYQIFRKVQVNANGANDANAGTWIRPILFFNHSTMGQTTLVGTILTPLVGGPLDANGKRELSIERLCASCHTVGTYKNSGGVTHQANTYPQWTNSGHGTRQDPAWAEFSANPAAYVNPNSIPPAPYVNAGSHQTTYPVDMSKANSFGNYVCFKCHNGVGSLNWQNNVQGTAAATVVWGDESATCITCHDPHANFPGQTKNTRAPVVMTNYSTSSVKIFGNVFLDTQAVPSTTGNGTICIFCHQGRESGFTLYKTKIAPGKSAAGSFFNSHYLGTAGMLWGANAYEYAGKSYSFNKAHQGANCPTCHMANPTADNLNGGHSWNPNVATCNAASCHGGPVGPAVAGKTGSASPDLGTYRATFDTNDYDGNGSVDPIAVEIKNLQDKLIALLAANGIFYDDVNYPYFFNTAFDPAAAGTVDGSHKTATSQFKAWNTAVGGMSALKAAFNLNFAIKGLPSAGSAPTFVTNGAGLIVPITSSTLIPNASAAVHDYKYLIQLLRDSYEDYNAVAAVPQAALGGVRPAGTRAATVYGPGQ